MTNRKNAVITGASRGIGAKTAEALAAEGFNVIINYNKSEEAAKNLKDKILASGANADIYNADIGDYVQAKGLMDFCLEKHGKIDVLVNNAGISQIKLFTEISVDEWDEMVRVNLNGVFNCTQNAVKSMISNKQGKIINISSIWGIAGSSCEVHYSTAKAGIIGFTKALAKELGPSNIQVNCIAPGIILTDMMSGFSQADMDAMKEEIPLQRFGIEEDIANAVLFFASEKSDYITGQVLSPNGGILI